MEMADGRGGGRRVDSGGSDAEATVKSVGYLLCRQSFTEPRYRALPFSPCGNTATSRLHTRDNPVFARHSQQGRKYQPASKIYYAKENK